MKNCSPPTRSNKASTGSRVEALDCSPIRGRSSMVEPQPSKLMMPVRSWSAALFRRADHDGHGRLRRSDPQHGTAQLCGERRVTADLDPCCPLATGAEHGQLARVTGQSEA